MRHRGVGKYPLKEKKEQTHALEPSFLVLEFNEFISNFIYFLPKLPWPLQILHQQYILISAIINLISIPMKPRYEFFIHKYKR